MISQPGAAPMRPVFVYSSFQILVMDKPTLLHKYAKNSPILPCSKRHGCDILLLLDGIVCTTIDSLMNEMYA